MRLVVKVVLILLAVLAIERGTHFLTEGFTLYRISSHYPYHENWHVPIEKEEEAHLEKAVQKKFTYFAQGSQSYAFISEDGAYILKFFKHHRWRPPPFFEHLFSQSHTKKFQGLNATFESCKIAFTEFKEETGLLYLHLNRTDTLKRSVILVDKLHIEHRIDLDSTTFALQKNAQISADRLLQLKREGNIEEAKRALVALLNLTISRAQKGYSDKDPNVIKNFGWIGSQPIQIDIGGFHRDVKKTESYFFSQEIEKIHTKLHRWISRNFPELSEYADSQIAQITQQKDVIAFETP